MAHIVQQAFSCNLTAVLEEAEACVLMCPVYWLFDKQHFRTVGAVSWIRLDMKADQLPITCLSQLTSHTLLMESAYS